MRKTAVIIARVSTEKQLDGYSIPTQFAGMRKYCERIGYEVIAELQDDISGTVPLRERVGGRKLYDYIEGKLRADAAIFHTLDRVTRDEDLIEINVLRRDIRNAGMELHYADTGKSDLTTLGGVLDTFRAAIAAEERKKIIERGRRGRLGKAESGKWVGIGEPPYGYRKIGTGKQVALAINETESNIVRRIFAMYTGIGSPQKSVQAIAEQLTREAIATPSANKHGTQTKGWNARIIGFILKRKIYVGELEYRGLTQTVPIQHLAIIERNVFDAAQSRRAFNAQHRNNHIKNEYLLRSRIRCTCGASMRGKYIIGNAGRKKYLFYVCTSQSRPLHQRTCKERNVSAAVVENEIWEWLTSLLTNIDNMHEALERMKSLDDKDLQTLFQNISKTNASIEREQRKVSLWVSQYPDAGETELIALRENVKLAQTQIDGLKQFLNELTDQAKRVEFIGDIQKQNLMALVDQYKSLVENADFEMKKLILERLNLHVQLEHVESGNHRRVTVTADLMNENKYIPLKEKSHVRLRGQQRGAGSHLYQPKSSAHGRADL